MNIISNVNPTVTIEITVNEALVERKEISLSRHEATCLYNQLQDIESSKWEESEEVLKILDRMDTDIYEDAGYKVQINFDHKYDDVLEKAYVDELKNQHMTNQIPEF